jgi:hypothetical protein
MAAAIFVHRDKPKKAIVNFALINEQKPPTHQQVGGGIAKVLLF